MTIEGEELCSYEVYAGQRYGDAPQPAEFCENPVVPGEEFCIAHLSDEPDEPWDDRDYMLDVMDLEEL